MIGQPRSRTNGADLTDVSPLVRVHLLEADAAFAEAEQPNTGSDARFDRLLCVPERPVAAIYKGDVVSEPWAPLLQINAHVSAADNG
jgi:hypothetical protein